jgi:hypothetical protein
VAKATHVKDLFTRPVARDQADGRPPHAERMRHRLDHCPIGRALDGVSCDSYVQDRAIPFRTGARGAWVSPDY